MSIIDFDRLLEICELVIIIELDFRWFEASLAFFNKFLASTSALFAFSSILEIFLYSILYSSSEIMNFLAGCLCTIIVLHKSSKNCFSCPIFTQFSQFFELFLISLFFGEFFKKSSLLQLSIKESSHVEFGIKEHCPITIFGFCLLRALIGVLSLFCFQKVLLAQCFQGVNFWALKIF